LNKRFTLNLDPETSRSHRLASAHPLAPLRDPGTVRLRCQAVLRSVEEGVSPLFSVRREALDGVAERVAVLTLKRFPDLVIPWHSRWRHFESGGVDRRAQLDALLAGRSAGERARAYFDLTLISVLLDAGAGPQWRYTEEGQIYQRSEGLAVASFRAFVNGTFSATPDDPLRADAAALQRIDASVLRTVFQASPSNPVVGLEGRAGLLSRLGVALQAESARSGGTARPGLFYDRLTQGGMLHSVSASAVLGELLASMAPIWTSGSRVQGLPAGDVWPHLWAGAAVPGGQDNTTSGWVPFHKLSQWLTYSLLEPLQWAGVAVTGVEALTGLPEYRNGGLLLDAGVLVLRDPRLAARVWKPGDPLIIEWRALTVALLDEVAARVRARLGRTAETLPLACILEGGTWAAGREIARELREDGSPPLRIDSDGTVF
jgi:Protein of unknown function (DUF1688)